MNRSYSPVVCVCVIHEQTRLHPERRLMRQRRTASSHEQTTTYTTTTLRGREAEVIYDNMNVLRCGEAVARLSVLGFCMEAWEQSHKMSVLNRSASQRGLPCGNDSDRARVNLGRAGHSEKEREKEREVLSHTASFISLCLSIPYLSFHPCSSSALISSPCNFFFPFTISCIFACPP